MFCEITKATEEQNNAPQVEKGLFSHQYDQVLQEEKNLLLLPYKNSLKK